MFAKQALSIGVDHHSYPGMDLNACLLDARAVASSLQSIGFQTRLGLDTTMDQTQRLVYKFARSIQPGAVVFFYFSGHGCQFNGINYLLPSMDTGLDIDAIELTTINAQKLIYQMHQRRPRLVICVLDCCRNDPTVRDSSGNPFFGGQYPGLQPGLAPMEGPPGTIIVYACAAGEVSVANGRNRPNSMYTHHLLRYLRTPNMDIESVLKYVSKDVEKASNYRQIPYRYSSCNEFIYLVEGIARKGIKSASHHRSRRAVMPTHKSVVDRGTIVPYGYPWMMHDGRHGIRMNRRFIKERKSSNPMRYQGMRGFGNTLVSPLARPRY